MIRTLLLAAAALALSNASAFAQTFTQRGDPDYWFLGASATSGEALDTITFIDANRIEIGRQSRRAWSVGFMQNNSEGIARIEGTFEYDCAQRMQRTVEATIFFERGQPLSTGQGRWTQVQTNTPGEWQLDFACGDRTSAQFVQVRNGLPLDESARQIFEIVRRDAGSGVGAPSK